MKKYFVKSLLIFALVVFAFEINAQIKLSGDIVDRRGEPVPGALIDFANGYLKTTSDVDGKFSLIFPDTLTNRSIQFEAFSYKKKRMRINKGQEVIHVILLDSLHNLNTVTISTPKYGKFSDYSAQTIKMSTFDIQTNPAAMADMLGNMKVLPGVQTNDNDGRLIIQGGSPGESQIYINDLIVMNPYTLTSKNSGVRSRFSPDLFDGVVLQSGGFNAEFGQALSGVVNLNTKEREDMEAKTDITVASVFAGITHIDKKPSYAYRASVSYYNLEPYTRLVPDKYEWSKYYQQIAADFYLTKDFNPDTKMIAQLNFSNSGLDYAYYNVDSIRYNNDLNQKYFYAQLNLYHSFSPQWSLSLAGNVVVDKFTGTEVQYQNDKVEDLNIWNHNKINLQYSNGKFTNRVGIEYIHNPFKETYTMGEDYKMNVNNDLMSIYNDAKIFLNNNLSLSLGLRGEYSNYLKQFNIAPRLYVGYRLNRENIISASVGEYFQLPSMDYLKLTDNIDFTSAYKTTVSYSYVKKSSKFQVDAYYKKYKDAVTYKNGQFYAVDIANNGKGHGYGADVFIRNYFKSLEYWFTYSYNNTEKQYGHFEEKIKPSYVSSHSFNTTLKYWIAPLKSMIGMNYNISAGAPYYNESSPYNKLGTTPLRNRLDLSVSYLPKPWIIIHFGCQNVLGYDKNIYGYEYSKINPEIRKPIGNPDKRFFFLGVFITLSKDKKLNQLKSL